MTDRLLFPKNFPELKTIHLTLRMIHDEDADIIFRLYNDVRVMLQRGEPVFKSISQAEKLIFNWRKLFANGNGLRWGIVLNENEKLIGSIGFKKIMHQHLRADIGYELDPDYWNRGIMTETLKAVSTYGLQQMNLHSIEANITPNHFASKKVLENAGYKIEAHYQENYFYEDWWDSAIYSLRK